MAVGLASGVANSVLDALCRSVAWTEPAAFWVKLHIGDPGAAGASNPAGETDRIEAIMSAASGGAITNSSLLTWAAVSTTETYSHVSFWSASAAGTFLGSDALNSTVAVVAGNDFTIPVGDLDLSLTPIAA